MFRRCTRITPSWLKINCQTARAAPIISHYRPSHVQQIRLFNQEMTQGWPSPIVEFLKKENFTNPTTIQEKTLPKAMQKKDLVGIARTGSGKTLAFVIPAVMHVLEKRKSAGDDQSPNARREVSCLILSPTRELANQTAGVISKFGGINSLILVGGQSKLVQTEKLYRKNTDIVIATPGRLIDLVQSDLIDLSHITYLVLDEADRMLDMGFEPQIKSIVSKLPTERQTLMWSATWPPEIEDLAAEFMRDYDHIAIDGTELKANPNIEQKVEVCEGRHKYNILLENIKEAQAENAKILIFCATQRMVDQIEFQLMKDRLRSLSIHGRRTQLQRDRALEHFRQNRCRILVATDVAARGLDIADITHVINFDFPNTIEDYIHRIGRTARHTNSGKSITLFSTSDVGQVDDLIKILKDSNQHVPEELEQMSNEKHLYRRRKVAPKRNGQDYVNRIFSGPPDRRPSHSRSSHERPSYDRSSYDRSSYDRPSYDRPSYDRPSYNSSSNRRDSGRRSPASDDYDSDDRYSDKM